MWEVVVKTLAGLDCVIGFDVGLLYKSYGRSRFYTHSGADDE
jgi:hypothetical protein